MRCGVERCRARRLHAPAANLCGFAGADNAFKALDELDSQEAPDALKDVKQCYVDGSEQLENALNAYIELYTEIDSATDAQPFDWSTYDQRIADIQAAYNSGLEKLQEGDKTAADLPQ